MALPTRVSRTTAVDPFEYAQRDFDTLLNRLFNGSQVAGGDGGARLAPYGVDIREDADHFYVEASYVDRQLDYINISLENGLYKGRFWLPNRQQVEIRRQLPELGFPAGGVIRGTMSINRYRFNQGLPDWRFNGPCVVSVPGVQRQSFAFEQPIDAELREQGIGPERELADVRREAAETLGENLETGDAIATLKPIASGDQDSDVRREAIETLGEIAPTAETVRFLVGIAKDDRNEDAQREAIETLAEIGELGMPAVIELARTHPSPDIRRTALEEVANHVSAAQALDFLTQIARTDRNADVQRAAVENLGELHDDRAYRLLVEFARTHPESDVRRAAIETYTENASADSAVALLKGILAGDAPEDVYSAVLESLEELEGGAGIPVLIDAARSHPNREVRADALRRLAESDDPRAQKVFDQTLRRPPP